MGTHMAGLKTPKKPLRLPEFVGFWIAKIACQSE
jgi:hypothetical protein